MPPRESSLLSLLFGIIPLIASETAYASDASKDRNSAVPSDGNWATKSSPTTDDQVPQFGPGSHAIEDHDYLNSMRLSFTAYGGFIHYSGETLRRDATLLGGGGAITLEKARLDLDFQHVDIRFSDGSNVQQFDGTAALSWSEAEYAIRAFHHFSYDEKTSERTMSAYGFGFTTLPSWRWRAGMEVAWSQLLLNESIIHTAQAIPFISWTWWRQESWNITQEFSLLSSVTADAASSQGDKYFSADSDISIGWTSFRLSACGWAGERRFAIVNQGFAAYNLPVTYDHGYGLSFAWYSTHTMVQLQAQRQSFQHDDVSGKALSDSMILLFNASF